VGPPRKQSAGAQKSEKPRGTKEVWTKCSVPFMPAALGSRFKGGSRKTFPALLPAPGLLPNGGTPSMPPPFSLKPTGLAFPASGPPPPTGGAPPHAVIPCPQDITVAAVGVVAHARPGLGPGLFLLGYGRRRRLASGPPTPPTHTCAVVLRGLTAGVQGFRACTHRTGVMPSPRMGGVLSKGSRGVLVGCRGRFLGILCPGIGRLPRIPGDALYACRFQAALTARHPTGRPEALRLPNLLLPSYIVGGSQTPRPITLSALPLSKALAGRAPPSFSFSSAS
jgi:hypothetical protein